MVPPDTRVRAVSSSEDQVIELIAKRMQLTLDEVIGTERDHDRYSLDWLVNRVRQHLDPAQLTGQVLVAEQERVIAGHAILRIDQDEAGEHLGLFATIYVAPDHRRQGVAHALIESGENWMREHELARAATYTHRHNHKLHQLFGGLGYELQAMPKDFVKLSRPL